MNWRISFWRRLKHERELDEELKFHLEEQIKDHITAGMSPEDARRKAALEFGGLAQVKEECRDERSYIWLEQLWQDMSFALRQLRKAPGFTTTAILTVAMGIGTCTALFSVVNGVLLRPLSLPEADRIVVLGETRPPNTILPLAPAAYLDWVKQSSAFEDIAIIRWRSYNAMSGGHAVNFGGQSVTASFFRVIGVRPMLGRSFLPEEEIEGHDHVLILSNRVWKNEFGARENILNEIVQLDDQAYTVIGVMPDQNLVWNAPVYTPKTFSNADRGDYGSHVLGCIGRLKAGVSIEAARRDMEAVTAQIGRAHPDSNKGHGARVTPLLESQTNDVRFQLFILLGAVGFLLLIACVNVVNLLLARANARSREIAVRAALGAGRGRIIRQFICESLLISVAGGALGALLAYGSMGSLARFAGHYLPRTDQFVVDGLVLVTTVGLMLATGIGVGLVPALQATRGDMIESLKDAGRSSSGRKRHRVQSALVVVEIALALMLLVGTGLLARSLTALQLADQGFKTDHVYIGQLAFNSEKRYGSPEKALAFMDETIARGKALPDVHSLAFSTGLPMAGMDGLLFTVVGTPEVPITAMPVTNDISITADYFKAMSIPMVQGREFGPHDLPGAPRVVIVNEEMVRRHFAGRNPIGQQLMIMTMADKPDAVREIVGVAGDVKPFGPQSEILPQVYEPLAQRPLSGVHLILRVKGDARALPATVTDIVRSIDLNLPFQGLTPYDGAVANGWFRQKFSMTLFMVFSAIAVVLAAIGIYGVMAYSVSQRTQEIGIRVALGARPGDVMRLALGRGVRIVLTGLVAGTLGSLAFGRVLRALLFNIQPYDPLTLLSVGALLAVVAFFACWFPARRATKVDPVVALRSE